MSDINNETKLQLNMDDILNASLGEVSNELSVTFKKTVLVRNYETEVVEAITSVKLDHPIKGIERMFITAILEIQMEYTVFCQLAVKGTVTQREFEERKKSLVNGLYSIKYKADLILGEGVIDKYLKDTGLDKEG